jgi:Pro-kumamolisin, activation domain/Putative Ig domain
VSARHLISRTLCVLTGIAATLLVVVSSAAAASSSPVRVGSPRSHPARSKVIGALPSATRIALTVALKPRDPLALASYAAAVSTPGSSVYHHYLTVGEFRQRFGPTKGQVNAVQGFLSARGLRPGSVSANGLAIPVSASAGAISQAFSLSFQRVALAGGRHAFANTQAPEFTASSAGIVQGVIGLDTLSPPHPQGLHFVSHPQGVHPTSDGAHPSPQIVTGGPQPCPAANSSAQAIGVYTADQLASAYRFSSLYGAGDQGAGQTIAVYELEPNLASDIAAYQSCYGTSASVTYESVDGGSGPGAGVGEAALDIEDVIGLAPKANVIVYQGPNDGGSGPYDTYNQIVTDDTAKVISTSWGLCEHDQGSSEMSAENTLFQEAATQGQSIFAASGDAGSEACGTSSLAVGDPASQPFVTGVGGTNLSTLGPPPAESVWNGQCTSGPCAGGGGISSMWKMPSYQSGAPSSLNVVNANSSGTPCKLKLGNCREVPDVSADADPATGYLINYNGGWAGIGGTSAAAPLWAAFAALVNASSTCTAPIGFANPALYTAAANAYSSDFNDITMGNNDAGNVNGGEFPAGPGFDMASGLGTPNGSTLPATLCSGGSVPANTVTVANPGGQTSTLGSAVSVPITATNSTSGDSLTYSATNLPQGLSITASNGVASISGAPSTANSWAVTIKATDTTTGAFGTASFTWTVAKRSTATTLSCSPRSASPGVATTCTATVADTDAPTPSTPTGTVSFGATGQGSFGGSGSCSLAAVTASSVSCQVTYRPGTTGTPEIFASYPGDGAHLSSSGESSVTVPAPPSARITSPANNQTFALGHSVKTTFACSEGANGPGLSSCRDSNGTNAPGSGALNTGTAGTHTYTVTTRSQDGQTGQATITYTVVTAPANTGGVRIGGTPHAGAALVCLSGSWTGSPTGFTYQWSRDGTPIVGARSSTYRVQQIDEGNALTCAVSASNIAGQSAPATSAAINIPVPFVAGCPRATGAVSGATLGLIKLGNTRKQAKHAYRHSSDRATRYQDLFCLTPIGIRAGYASPKLLSSLPARQRKGLQGRVIWISTGSASYAINGIRPGATLAAAAGRLKLGRPFQNGANTLYLAPAGGATAVLRVRGGIVQEIGIANKRLTKSRASQRILLGSFS